MSTLLAAPEPEVLSITFDLKQENMQGFVFAVTPTRLAKKFKQECVIFSLSLSLSRSRALLILILLSGASQPAVPLDGIIFCGSCVLLYTATCWRSGIRVCEHKHSWFLGRIIVCRYEDLSKMAQTFNGSAWGLPNEL